MGKLDFPVFDADNHLYETEDAFTRHLPKQYDGLFKYVQVNGRTKIAVDNVISDYIPNPTFEVVARPGAFAEYFSGTHPEGKSLRELAGKPIRTGEQCRTAEPRRTVLHAFNKWLSDEWTFSYRDRTFATPIVNPSITERGVAELEWLLGRGAK